jgi:hypothetical protein
MAVTRENAPQIKTIALPPRSIFLHPIVIVCSVWLGVVFLYSMRLSYLLYLPLSAVIVTVTELLVPFIASAMVVAVLAASRRKDVFIDCSAGYSAVLDEPLLEKRLNVAFKIWLPVTVVEIVYGRGFPMLWALLHNGKIYTDFGIPTVHGLIDSLLLAMGMCHFVLALSSKRKRNYYYAFFVPVWAILIINRNMLLVALLEYIVVFLCMRTLKRTTAIRTGILAIAFVLVFGIVGDIRQPEGGGILQLAQPTENFPRWLPSGALWAYIYATTPLQNLVYNTNNMTPDYNLLFPSTFSPMFPTVIRNIIYADSTTSFSGSLEVSAFNVSTAFTSSFADYGAFGIIVLAAFLGIICELSWLRTGVRSMLVFAVLTQCLVLTVFFDHFFDLPVITQVIWLRLFFRRKPRNAPLADQPVQLRPLAKKPLAAG